MAPPAHRAQAEMLPGLRQRESPIAVAEACSAAMKVVLGTRCQQCHSRTEQRGVSGEWGVTKGL
jgi:cytochrome c5